MKTASGLDIYKGIILMRIMKENIEKIICEFSTLTQGIESWF
jgi:hypothetical protein